MMPVAHSAPGKLLRVLYHAYILRVMISEEAYSMSSMSYILSKLRTQSKGTHADHLLLDLLASGSLAGATFAPRDVFWGQLGGCLEAVDGGTTTVLDHSNINNSPAHADAAIDATKSSGIRSFYAFTPIKRLKSWKPFEWDDELLPAWEMRQLQDLAKRQPFAGGRIKLAFGFDWYFLPRPMVVDLFETVRGLGVKLITSHYSDTPIFGNGSVPALLAEYGLLKKDIIFSHACQADDRDASLLHEYGAFISSTPDTELQLCLGHPICFDPAFYPNSSLGSDLHSVNSSDMLSAMRLALQTSRGTHNQRYLSYTEPVLHHNKANLKALPTIQWHSAPKNPKKTCATAEEAFNLGTIMGAKAVGLEHDIGSLQVGKKADIVIFDATSTSMVCAADNDPVAAIVQHASVRDVETVIIDGEIRKENHQLASITIEDTNFAELGTGTGSAVVEWGDVARELGASRERLRKRWEGIDFEDVTRELISAFRIDETRIVDAL
ncbi:MAG: hypothetical protein Q9212_007053 [Teloschistes hypoglaucus]